MAPLQSLTNPASTVLRKPPRRRRQHIIPGVRQRKKNRKRKRNSMRRGRERGKRKRKLPTVASIWPQMRTFGCGPSQCRYMAILDADASSRVTSQGSSRQSGGFSYGYSGVARARAPSSPSPSHRRTVAPSNTHSLAGDSQGFSGNELPARRNPARPSLPHPTPSMFFSHE